MSASANQDGEVRSVMSTSTTATAIPASMMVTALMKWMASLASALLDTLVRNVNTLLTTALMNPARTEDPAPSHPLWTHSSVNVDLVLPAHQHATLRMMSAVLAHVIPVAPSNVLIWTTSLNANVGMDMSEISARPMLMIVFLHPAEMVEHVETWLEDLNVSALLAGKESSAKKTKRDAMNRLAKTMLFVWIFSRITSALVHQEQTENVAKLLLRDALEILV